MSSTVTDFPLGDSGSPQTQDEGRGLLLFFLIWAAPVSGGDRAPRFTSHTSECSGARLSSWHSDSDG